LIKSQKHRSQEKNKIAALSRLNEMIVKASLVEKKRTATTSTYGSKQKRMDKKTQRGQTKSLRGKIDY
jgi:ribosome-associated protein